MDATPCDNLADQYLGEGDRGEENNLNDHVTLDTAAPEPKEEEQQPDNEIPEPAEPVRTCLSLWLPVNPNFSLPSQKEFLPRAII